MRITTIGLRSALLLLGGLLLLAVSGSAGAQSCTFRNPPPGAITFPTLDPSNATTVTASTQVNIRCTGIGTPASWTFSGLYGANPNLQMKHSTLNAYIAYSVANPPTLVFNFFGFQAYNVTATILPASYINAYAGTYTDTLTISIAP